MITTSLGAKSVIDLQEEINLEMCESTEHYFSFEQANCTYCAHGLKKNTETGKCEGVLNVFGKCNANDHFHAARQECVYCAHGYVFDEDLRTCMEEKLPETSE